MTTKTKTKTPPLGAGGLPIFGDDLPITPFQIKRIRGLCQFDEDFKCEVVHSHTGQTSLKKLTQKQAVLIIRSFENGNMQRTASYSPTSEGLAEAWAAFDKANPKHKLILSLCRQANWTTQHAKYGEVADLDRLDKWLKSDRAPVNKPLKKMDAKEIEKTIAALGGIVKSIYK